VEELTRFAIGENLADTMTRRREAYHVTAVEASASARADDARKKDSAPSIHDIEESLTLGELPPVDRDDRALFVERILPDTVTIESYAQGEYEPLISMARVALTTVVEASETSMTIRLTAPDKSISKELTFFPDGSVRANFSWDSSLFPGDAWFTTEISVSRPHVLRTEPETEVWQHPIETVAKSERGLDRTLQGTSYLVRWPIGVGSGEVELSD
jgi:hypothetical protein